MAIYKIFPEKSATLYSYYPSLNSGIDEILELSTYETIESTYEVSRPIIYFSHDEIVDVISNKVNGASYDAFLRLSLAYASQIPTDYTIYCYPLSGSWNIGTGRLSDSPIITDGVSWAYKDQLSGSVWYDINNIPPNTTYYDDGSNRGGGLWWYTHQASQSFTNMSSKDINMEVTNIVDAWYNTIFNPNIHFDNDGFILKHSSSLEFNSSSLFELKYFSANTHTIYPPCLEIRWNDFSYNTTLTEVTSPNIVATLANNQSEYQQNSVQRFRVNVRDRFPTRAFQATSIYLNNKVLPQTSYYSIKDLDTEEIIIDYDDIYTRISADNTGNYFDIYMDGLEPERYYKISIKTIIDNSTLILDDNYYFKVIR